MGLFKELGNLAGIVVGGVIGGTVSIVGEATNSDLIKEIGAGVYTASKNGGNLIGKAADGAVGVVGGIITSNNSAVKEGFGQLGDVTKQTVSGIGQGLSNVAKNSGDLISGIRDGDDDKVSNASKNLIKTVAISVLAVGGADYVGEIGDDGKGADTTESL